MHFYMHSYLHKKKIYSCKKWVLHGQIYDLLLGPSPDQVWLADRLDEAAGQLRVELAA
jgi:hypothetical protein